MKDHMLVSCEVAGKKEKCTNFFTRVPTDSGMCCALNWESALKTSEYQQLVKSMQESKGDKKMQSQAGEKGGLRMVLDLHSNLVSFGTLNQDYNAFKLFIGQLEEFPALKQRSIRLEPGREHFVELSAKVDERSFWRCCITPFIRLSPLTMVFRISNLKPGGATFRMRKS